MESLVVGLVVGLVFGIVNLVVTWLYPLLDDNPATLLRFYGPMFSIWALASFRAARRSRRVLPGVIAGGVVAFGTFVALEFLIFLRNNVFLDELTHRADWQNMMARFRASGLDSLRLFVNLEYLKGAPFKIGVASTIGLLMGIIGSVFGMVTRRRIFASACVLVAGIGSGAAQKPAASNPEALRAQFLQTISRPAAPLAPSPSQVTTANGYVQELVSFAAEPHEQVPLLILKKAERRGRQPVFIALHGTGGSKEGMRRLLEGYADSGFVAVAMDARHHGERATPIPGLANAYQSAMLRAYRTGDGHPYLYDTVWDVMRLVDYLSTRADVDPGRIGLLGNSKGGTEAYLAAAADPRIAVVAPLIGVQSFAWSLRHAAGWEARVWTFRGAVEAAAAESREQVGAGFVRKFYDRIAPGLTDTFDGPAMLPLIAPRPMIVVNGDSDPRSPLGGVREAVAAAERAYAAARAPEKFSFVLEADTAHEVTAEASDAVRKWFVRWLAPVTN